jgi:hypothetical protein
MRTAIGNGGFNEIFAPQQNPRTLRPHQAFAAAESIEIALHFGIKPKVVDGRDVRGIIQQQRNLEGLGDGYLFFKTGAEAGGLDHGCFFTLD